VNWIGGELIEKAEGLDRLFFELASESRLGILRTLQTGNFKMQELGRKLDLTDTEAFRQVQRLSEAALIQKQQNGTYAITQYGKLVLYLSRSIECAHKNRDCFLTRDIWRLPEPFIERLGELNDAKLITDMFEMFSGANQIISKAEKYVWMIGDKPVPAITPNLIGQSLDGVKFRLIFHESLLPLYKPVPGEEKFIEKRSLSENIPATLLVTEKVAGVSFLSIDGRPDYALFFGQDPAFLRWTHDLFLYYWERAKKCYPQ
jgi:predicted transcriptional regulator